MKIEDVQAKVLKAIAEKDPALFRQLEGFATTLKGQNAGDLNTRSFAEYLRNKGLDYKLALDKMDKIIQAIPGLSTGAGQVAHYANLGIGKLSEITSKFGGLPGKALTAVLAMGGATIASAGEITGKQLAQAGLNSAGNGLGDLVAGEGPTHGILCELFGKAVVPAALGFVAGALATPFVGAAVAADASMTLAQPATQACNDMARKFSR